MLITAITHAAARDKAYAFRGLTPEGQEQCKGAAAQYSLRTDDDVPAFTAIISSPKPRCLETVILFAKELDNDLIDASSVAVEAGIKAGDVEGGELEQLARRLDAEHLLVSGHADLVKTLPDPEAIRDAAADGGWFNTRPVLFQIEYQRDRPWHTAELRWCVGLKNGEWQELKR